MHEHNVWINIFMKQSYYSIIYIVETFSSDYNMLQQLILIYFRLSASPSREAVSLRIWLLDVNIIITLITL